MPFTTIVSAEDLYERLGDPDVVVFDCRHSLTDLTLGRRLYDEAHVPGAFFADLEEDLAGTKTGKNGRHPLPDPRALARFLGTVGVSHSTQIVAYDEGADIFAARLWFLSRWIGHDAAAVLDGGFAAWTARGYPVTAAPSEPAREGSLTVRLHPELLVDADYVRAHLDAPEMQLLDARAKKRYTGETEPMDRVAGHIPGARHRCWNENYDASGKLKSAKTLRKEFAAGGFDAAHTVHQCGSGISATVNHLAMVHAGLEGSRLYNGSWSEWVADPSRPIATGE
ncbi:MAG TPA: sulfurtransferase [Candidatus Babeliales bacterium]|nr:sulfurtransferase [Candidatus Babeliales bacterium]